MIIYLQKLSEDNGHVADRLYEIVKMQIKPFA